MPFDGEAQNRTLNRFPVHPSFTSEQISKMVEHFYQQVRAHESLGPIFEHHLVDRWPAHLSKMKDFWEAVLLRTGVYKGKPVPAHLKLTEVVTGDFGDWLGLFRRSAQEFLEPEAVPLVVATAERIAKSLQFAMFGKQNPELRKYHTRMKIRNLEHDLAH